MALSQWRGFSPVSAEKIPDCRQAKKVGNRGKQGGTYKKRRVRPEDVPPAIVVNALNLTPQAGHAKNKENGRKDPDKDGTFLPRLI